MSQKKKSKQLAAPPQPKNLTKGQYAKKAVRTSLKFYITSPWESARLYGWSITNSLWLVSIAGIIVGTFWGLKAIVAYHVTGSSHQNYVVIGGAIIGLLLSPTLAFIIGIVVWIPVFIVIYSRYRKELPTATDEELKPIHAERNKAIVNYLPYVSGVVAFVPAYIVIRDAITNPAEWELVRNGFLVGVFGKLILSIVIPWIRGKIMDWIREDGKD